MSAAAVPPRPLTIAPEPHALPTADVLARLGVDAARGLTSEEVAARRVIYGENRLAAERQRTALSILWHQFESPVVWLLALAAALGLAFGDWPEAVAIAVVLLLNSAIGFATELKAERSMDALRALGSTAQLVRRNGRPVRVDAEDIVPGDILLIEEGDVVTADARLVEATNVAADESALTGESVPVDKTTGPVAGEASLGDRASMVFKGTAVTRGCAIAVTTATGARTEVGRIAELAGRAAPQPSPLETKLAVLTRQLIVLTLAVAALIVAAGVVQGQSWLLMIEAGIALAVAAIPEGLPVVATLVLARGMWRMAEKNAVIERLSAVETLGATTVIFTDKTGTITENRMSVRRVRTASHELVLDGSGPQGAGTATPVAAEISRLLTAAALCTSASLRRSHEENIGDPMELALLAAAKEVGLEREPLLSRFPEISRQAFDSDLRMMATVHAANGHVFAAVKGAPEAILPRATHVAVDGGAAAIGNDLRQLWSARVSAMGEEGFRVLAVAERVAQQAPDGVEVYRGLTLLGLVGLQDPPRADVPEAIRACRAAGIRVVMATGDHAATAQSIARAIGLGGDPPRVIEGRSMSSASPPSQAELLGADIFARVSPAQKLELIGTYQAAGAVVAMTGDGVNDAPALRKADIGIAMGQRGTEIARQAAAMVLRDDAFPTIVGAVREGRVIFGNIRRFIHYLLACNLSEVMVVGVAVMAGLPLPLLPLQILFLNLVTDVFPAFALALGEGEPKVMQRPPRHPRAPIVSREAWLAIAGHGLAITVATLGAMVLAQRVLLASPEASNTVAFLTLAFAQLWHVFNMAEEDGGWANSVTRNTYVWLALVGCGAILVGAVMIRPLAHVLQVVPPTAPTWLLVMAMSFVPLGLARTVRWLVLFGKARKDPPARSKPGIRRERGGPGERNAS